MFLIWILKTIDLKNRQVDLHSEEVRSQWVAHEGKKELEVNCDEFVKGKANNWASAVSGKPDSFSEQIKVILFTLISV